LNEQSTSDNRYKVAKEPNAGGREVNLDSGLVMRDGRYVMYDPSSGQSIPEESKRRSERRRADERQYEKGP
jgi:hypothetical protein